MSPQTWESNNGGDRECSNRCSVGLCAPLRRYTLWCCRKSSLGGAWYVISLLMVLLDALWDGLVHTFCIHGREISLGRSQQGEKQGYEGGRPGGHLWQQIGLCVSVPAQITIVNLSHKDGRGHARTVVRPSCPCNVASLGLRSDMILETGGVSGPPKQIAGRVTILQLSQN